MNLFMRKGFFSAAVLISTLCVAGPCQADEWSRMQVASQRAQQASTAAGTLCSAQAAARTQIATLAGQIATSHNTFQQRLQDSLISDVQRDGQRLAPALQSFQSKASQLAALRFATGATAQPLESSPGFPNTVTVTPDVMNAVRQMVDQATTIHETAGDLMEENAPLMSFAPQPSYALWMALANNKQNPSWYQNRDQLHVRVQDNMDQLQRKAYAVFHGMNYSSPTSADVRTIYLRFVDMRTIWNQGSVDLAKDATQEIVNALNAYPGIVRQHRTTLTQEAEGWATQMETALQQAKSACMQLALVKAENNAILGGAPTIKPGVLKPGAGTTYEDVLQAKKLADKAKG